jgi:hypothetical protein
MNEVHCRSLSPTTGPVIVSLPAAGKRSCKHVSSLAESFPPALKCKAFKYPQLYLPVPLCLHLSAWNRVPSLLVARPTPTPGICPSSLVQPPLELPPSFTLFCTPPCANWPSTSCHPIDSKMSESKESSLSEDPPIEPGMQQPLKNV